MAKKVFDTRDDAARFAKRQTIPSTRKAPDGQPKRIQRKRTKGWRMPEGAVYVGRGSEWGNPYRVGDPDPFRPGEALDHATAAKYYGERFTASGVADIRNRLGGKDLACWCPLDKPCHADILLRLANQSS